MTDTRMAATRPPADRHADHRSRATQIVCALVRDLQFGLSRLNPLRHAEIPPAAVDRSAERVLELLREVADGATEDAVRRVLPALVRDAVRAELAAAEAADLAVIARTGTADPT